MDISILYTSMEEELAAITGLSASLYCVRAYIEKLKQNMVFNDENEEINFFKFQKPKFYSWQIFLIEKENIIRNLPVGTASMKKQYLLQELTFSERIFNQNRSVYQYYLDGDSHRDRKYFLRSELHDPFNIDPAFSTNEDYLFAKFKAAERLQDYLIGRLRLLENDPDSGLAERLIKHRGRRWTGDKVKLVEIAYGIFFTKQMNDGKAEISEIVSWLEDSLLIDLSQAYRIFLDIKRRKTTSYTKYLDEMRESIVGHIEETFK